ncbi:response regulator PleD [compost metagenome]
MLLPEADADVARKVAERCQRLLQKKSILHALSPHGRRVTVSIGAGTVVPDAQGERADFIKAVDQRLYVAKNNGRDRVEHVQWRS